MKKIHFILISVLFFTACNSKFSLQKRKYSRGFYFSTQHDKPISITNRHLSKRNNQINHTNDCTENKLEKQIAQNNNQEVTTEKKIQRSYLSFKRFKIQATSKLYRPKECHEISNYNFNKEKNFGNFDINSKNKFKKFISKKGIDPVLVVAAILATLLGVLSFILEIKFFIYFIRSFKQGSKFVNFLIAMMLIVGAIGLILGLSTLIPEFLIGGFLLISVGGWIWMIKQIVFLLK